jgi:hypothetical protein
MPVRMYRMQNKDVSAVIPERRQNNAQSIVERVVKPPYAPEGYASVDLTDETRTASAPASGAAMGKLMGKVGHRMGLLMNTFNTIVFSTIGTLSSGHFTWGGWLFGAAVGWCTGAVITSIIPVKNTQDWVLEKTKTDGKTLKGKLLASLSTNFIIMPAMTIVMGLAMPSLSAMNIEKGITQTETECTALQLQQSDLKLEQAALQGQYDTMSVNIEWLQKSVDEATNPADKGKLNGELEGKKAALTEMQAGIDQMQAGIDGMQEGIDGMTTSIAERKNAVNGIRAAIPRSLPLSAILNTIIGITLGLFTQPFFIKLIMKSVFGKNAPKE